MSLEEYLRSRALEGTTDSEGRFTVDFARAFAKLAEYGSALPHGYLLRVVQAAVVAGAPCMNFRWKNGRLEARFAASPPALADLLAAFSEGAQPADRVCDHLVAAMRGSPRNWLLRLGGATLQRRDDTFIAQRADGAGDDLAWEIELSKRDQVLAQALLAEHCRYSPVPVVWNGTSLRDAWPSPSPSERSAGDLVDLAQVLRAADHGQPWFVLPGLPLAELAWDQDCWFWKGCKGWFGKSTLFAGQRPCWVSVLDKSWDVTSSTRLSRALRWPLYPPGGGRIRLLVDGVTMMPVEAPGLEQVEVLEAASWAKTDLSGLQIVQDREFDRFVEQLKGEVKLLRRLLKSRFDRIEVVRRGRARGHDKSLKLALERQGIHMPGPRGLSDWQLAGSAWQRPEWPVFSGYRPLLYLADRRMVATYLCQDETGGEKVVVQQIRNEKHFAFELEQYGLLPQSPRIVRLRDVFTHRGGYDEMLYLVFPYIEGFALSELESLSPKVLAALARGVHEMHQARGHGYLCPQNVILREDGSVMFRPDLPWWLRLTSPIVGEVDCPTWSKFAYQDAQRILDSRRVSNTEACRRQADLLSLGRMILHGLNGTHRFPLERDPEPIKYLFQMLEAAKVPPPSVSEIHPGLGEELAQRVQPLLDHDPEARHCDLIKLACLLDEAGEGSVHESPA